MAKDRTAFLVERRESNRVESGLFNTHLEGWIDLDQV